MTLKITHWLRLLLVLTEKAYSEALLSPLHDITGAFIVVINSWSKKEKEIVLDFTPEKKRF